MIYFVNGKARFSFSEDSIRKHIDEIKSEQTVRKRLAA